MKFIYLFWIIVFFGRRTALGLKDCASQCQARIAITAGVASVVEELAKNNLKIDFNDSKNKHIKILGFYYNPLNKLCSLSCSHNTSTAEFAEIDKLLDDQRTEIKELMGEQQQILVDIIEMNVEKEKIVTINKMKDQSKLLNQKVKQQLMKSDWFARLDAEKQDQLSKYAQSRMHQKNALQDLKELNLMMTHSGIAMKSDNVINDYREHFFVLDYAWVTFNKIQKDGHGGMSPGVLFKEFITTSAKMGPSMTLIIDLLKSGASLWAGEGWCESEALDFFNALLQQSLYLRSIAKTMQGYQLNKDEYDKFILNMQEIKVNYKSSCYGKKAVNNTIHW